MSMFGKATLIGATLTLALLAGCDSLPQGQERTGDSDVPASPAATEPQVQQPVPQPQVQEQSETPVAQTPVSFFLAQEQADERLVELKLSDGSLWAVPDAVLTWADLASVEPRRTNEGQAFVRFGFNEQGTAKLAELSQRFAGNLLMVAVGRDVVGLARLEENDGQSLDIGMVSDEQAIAVADAVAAGTGPAPLADE